MARVIFYEKPGCGTNARQKLMLANAGHALEVKSLLAEPWTVERLASFFGPTPVASWFNPAAPAVKSGGVDPAAMTADAALALMVEQPILIRRPLVEVDGARCAGFDREPVLSLLAADNASVLPQGCSRATEGACPDPTAIPQP
ncbi:MULTISPECIES: ArsC/Spx/MgsR family protein [unclassified Xanthobacter]|uniref:ArsC/Spx/MgsR family protein n=1 Tax=unclassified Xanthobacter TaxID=2623496 RepID=UPI001EDF5B7C